MPTAKRPSKPSAWNAHLAAFRASHPRLTMKECMQQASKSYRCSAGAASARTVASSSKKTYRAAAAKTSNSWIAHVQAYRASHPGVSYTEALQQAASSYQDAVYRDSKLVIKNRKNIKTASMNKHGLIKATEAPAILKKFRQLSGLDKTYNPRLIYLSYDNNYGVYYCTFSDSENIMQIQHSSFSKTFPEAERLSPKLLWQ